jgi:hypothetical protein
MGVKERGRGGVINGSKGPFIREWRLENWVIQSPHYQYDLKNNFYFY